MARQLYDYWFVQFDFPDANGKPYKSSGGKMVYNPILKREIPEGWEVKNIGDIATTFSGGTPTASKQEYYKNGTIPWINSGELNEPFITKTSNFISELGYQNSSAKWYKEQTILIALYGATAGKVSLLSFPATSNQAVCGIMPNNKDTIHIIRYYLTSLYPYFISLSSGSARDNISQEIVRNTKIALPNELLIKMFHNNVEHKIKLIIENQKQILSLTKQRDELLPLLMNGQVNFDLFANIHTFICISIKNILPLQKI